MLNRLGSVWLLISAAKKRLRLRYVLVRLLIDPPYIFYYSFSIVNLVVCNIESAILWLAAGKVIAPVLGIQKNNDVAAGVMRFVNCPRSKDRWLVLADVAMIWVGLNMELTCPGGFTLRCMATTAKRIFKIKVI